MGIREEGAKRLIRAKLLAQPKNETEINLREISSPNPTRD